MSDDSRDGPWTISCGTCPWRLTHPTYRGSVSEYRRHMRWWHTKSVLARRLRLALSALGFRHYFE